VSLVTLSAPPAPGPEVAFRWLDALWVQVTGTRCNIACRHCFISCGPKADQIPMMSVESATPDGLLERLATSSEADVLLCTHTGIHWQRRLPSGRRVVNVGALGRPANDGRTEVWYAFLDTRRAEPFELVPVAYDHERVAREMRAEKLPEEFVETLTTGWWTTRLEILPVRERLAGRF
jgi:hypothetical protein